MTATYTTKYEIFDRTIANKLLKEDSSIVTDEQKTLIQKLLRKTKGNLLEVKYSYAKGYENLKVGRVYAEQSNSLGCMTGSIIRAPMCEKHYHDIDTVNCHYTIAYQYAEKHKLANQNIKKYVENREEWLNQVMEQYGLDRTDAKTLYLKIAYGGSLPDNLECPEMQEHVEMSDLNINLQSLKNEMNALAEHVWENNKSWQDLRVKTNSLKQSGKNKKFKMLSLFLQTEERKILNAMDKFFTDKGRSVDILIHDGCMIRKHENEKVFPRELMNACEEFIEAYTLYKVKLEQKPIIMEWSFSENQTISEDTPGFWKTHFIMNGKLYRESEHFDRPLHITNAKDYCRQFKQEFNTMDSGSVYAMVCEKPIRAYTSFGFHPYGSPVPVGIYNTFKGFAWTAMYNKPGLLSNEDYYTLIEVIAKTPWSLEQQNMWDKSKTKWQIEEVLCYNTDPEIQMYNIRYFMNTLAHILFNPTKPTEKVLCLRNEQGGSGKTGLLERHFADKLLGEEYFTSQSSSKHIFGEFNSSIANKLFILCEEAETKDTKDFTSQIKAAVTRKRNPIRLMRTDIYNENNYCTYIANTNKQTAFEFDPKNRRRFPQIDCKEYTLTQKDEIELCAETNSVQYNKLFFEYILAHYNTEFNFNEHPKAESVEQLTEQFKSPFLQFFEIILYDWDEYYTDKLSSCFIHGRENLDLHKKDIWKVKAELFCDIYKEVSKILCGPEFSSKIKFAAFRQSKELNDMIKKYPLYFIKKVNNYKGKNGDKEIGTFYKINLKEFRTWYKKDLNTPKKTLKDHYSDDEPSPKKPKIESE